MEHKDFVYLHETFYSKIFHQTLGWPLFKKSNHRHYSYKGKSQENCLT